MKKIIGWITGISGIALTAVGIVLVCKFVFLYKYVKDELFTESVGIIGGADGPTAIFVTRETGLNPAVIPIIVIAGAALIVISCILRSKK